MFLDRDDLDTHELGHASLSKLIAPIVDSGNATAPTFARCVLRFASSLSISNTCQGLQ